MRKPFFKKTHQCWYVWINVKQVKLAKDKTEAFAKWHDLISNQETLSPTVKVVVLLDHYLDWVQRRRAEATYVWYRNYIQSFASHIGPRLAVNELKPFHVTKWVDETFDGQSNSTKNGAIKSVLRAFNWAVTEGHIGKNPVVGVEKPPANRREMFLADDEFQNVLVEKSTDSFERDLWHFLWESGCRVQEVRKIESKHFEASEKRIILKPSEDKIGYHRVIYLNDIAFEIANRLSEKNPHGPIFLNSRRKPWTSNAIRCRFKKFGVKGLCGTVLRHSFCQRMLTNGVDSLTVAVLMGHRDLTMVSRVYSHLSRNPSFLHEQLAKGTKRNGDDGKKPPNGSIL